MARQTSISLLDRAKSVFVDLDVQDFNLL